MTRMGNRKIDIPKGVTVSVKDKTVNVAGPKGKQDLVYHDGITIKVEGAEVSVSRNGDNKRSKELHGLYRALLASMIVGVSEGYVKTLELVGVGYRASKAGKKLALQLGFSHPIEIDPPVGVDINVEGTNKILVSGINKEHVGQLAATIKALRPVEPYKGKGIRYAGQYVRRKAGKAAKAAGGAA
ncbi:MAG: 50S ribosomal protein L6 [Candidatus Margulisiibacteriota bacterium]|nr:50S ribosomal protein L6 [Candidatus Margulisiibacteriota bacterium]